MGNRINIILLVCGTLILWFSFNSRFIHTYEAPIFYMLGFGVLFISLGIYGLWSSIIRCFLFVREIILINPITTLSIVLIAGYFTYPIIIDGFSSPQYIRDRCLENSTSRYRVGAICYDGWVSRATGRGACSHHGGVSEWVYKEVQSKTRHQCMKYALERTWVEDWY